MDKNSSRRGNIYEDFNSAEPRAVCMYVFHDIVETTFNTTGAFLIMMKLFNTTMNFK